MEIEHDILDLIRDLPEEIEAISATKIREAMKNG